MPPDLRASDHCHRPTPDEAAAWYNRAVNFDESVAYMNGLLRFGEKYGNERLEQLLARLGNPHHRFPVVHVAGTKGKGSTTTFAASILRAAGFKTGAYLSPYVYDLRERIQVNGEMIPKADFARIVTRIRPHIDDLAQTPFGHTTEFELKTAAGLCYFAEQRVDYAVLEVGLGGRLDATNVIPPPLVSIITNIGYDHMEILGETLEAIAFEKAGIIKPHGLCVTAIEDRGPLKVVEDVCAEREARLIALKPGRDWFSHADGSVTIVTPRRRLEHVALRLKGRFQHANAAITAYALDAAEVPPLPDDAVRAGLESAYAPGRFELIRAADPAVVIDVAHNESSGRVLADALSEEMRARTRPVIVVAGVSRRHEPMSILGTLLPSLNPVALVATEPSFRPRAASEVADAARELGVPRVETTDNVLEAARCALKIARDYDDALIIVTGSFYTVGDLPPSAWQTLFGS